MNNAFFATFVYWQSRNWRHNKKAVEQCKNYGLHPLAKNFYAGKLKRRERKELEEHFLHIFTNRTEIYYIFSLCKSCYEDKALQQSRKQEISYPPYEIIG